MIAALLEYAALAIAYSMLAAGILETLLQVWRIQDPPLALRLRLLILAIPPMAPPLFGLLNPERGSEAFRRQLALLDLRNWLGPEPSLHHPIWILLLATIVATTALLVGLEAVGYVRHRLARRSPALHVTPLPEKLQDALMALDARGFRPSTVLAMAQPEPMAYAAGLRHPTVLVSTSLVDILDGEELEGVLAHEMAHVRRRDNWLGWLIFTLRLASFYNPVALLTFHQISHDTERICDMEAAGVTGKPLALASALIKVCRASYAPVSGRSRWSGRIASCAVALENRARRALVVDRVERLVHPENAIPVSYPGLRLGLAIAAVLAISYLVV